MRMRLLAIVSALLVAIVVFPFAASAQTSNTARISSTSYTDTAGSETDPLCETETIIEAIIAYSGVGPELGGTGVGDMSVLISGTYFEFSGTVEIDGQTVYVYGGGEMLCVVSAYAIVFGEFTAEADVPIENGVGTAALEPGETVCGSVVGSISDGAHPNQGRVSLTLSGVADSCVVEPPPPPTG